MQNNTEQSKSYLSIVLIPIIIFCLIWLIFPILNYQNSGDVFYGFGFSISDGGASLHYLFYLSPLILAIIFSIIWRPFWKNVLIISGTLLTLHIFLSAVVTLPAKIYAQKWQKELNKSKTINLEIVSLSQECEYKSSGWFEDANVYDRMIKVGFNVNNFPNGEYTLGNTDDISHNFKVKDGVATHFQGDDNDFRQIVESLPTSLPVIKFYDIYVGSEDEFNKLVKERNSISVDLESVKTFNNYERILFSLCRSPIYFCDSTVPDFELRLGYEFSPIFESKLISTISSDDKQNCLASIRKQRFNNSN